MASSMTPIGPRWGRALVTSGRRKALRAQYGFRFWESFSPSFSCYETFLALPACPTHATRHRSRDASLATPPRSSRSTGAVLRWQNHGLPAARQEPASGSKKSCGHHDLGNFSIRSFFLPVVQGARRRVRDGIGLSRVCGPFFRTPDCPVLQQTHACTACSSRPGLHGDGRWA